MWLRSGDDARRLAKVSRDKPGGRAKPSIRGRKAVLVAKLGRSDAASLQGRTYAGEWRCREQSAAPTALRIVPFTALVGANTHLLCYYGLSTGELDAVPSKA